MDSETRTALQGGRRMVIRAWFRNGTSPYQESFYPASHCVLTGIYAVAPADVARKAANVMALALGVEDACGVAEWNNEETRTKAEVVALFDRVLAADPQLAETREPVLA